MNKILRAAALGLVVALSAACGSGSTKAKADEVLPDAQASTRNYSDTSGNANQQRVVEILHSQGHLITVPEVKAASDSFVQMYRSGKTTREAAAQQFRVWLEEYIAKNPEKVKATAQSAGMPQVAPQAASVAPAAPAAPAPQQ